MNTPLLGAQMLLVAFGATTLVPLLTGISPNLALLGAGIGTLIFQFCTRRQIPIFLGSSFAFIGPIILGIQQFGLPATLSGLMAAGLMFIIISAIVKVRGVKVIERFLPPVVVGPVIMVIGLGLAPVAVNMALGKTGDGSAVLVEQDIALLISLASLFTTIVVSIFAKGMLKLMPIISGVAVGYVLSLFFGLVDFSAVASAAWFAIPEFVTPEFNWQAILFIAPIGLIVTIEHFGDILAISNVTGKNFVENPGIHRSLLGDGLATMTAASFGAPPVVSYGEVTGAVSLLKTYNPIIMTWAAVFAIGLAFIGKTGALLLSIPVPVMGGIMCLLFGAIAAIGLNTLINKQVDLSIPRNLVIVSVTLVFGIGGMAVGLGEFTLKGVGLCGIVAIILNLVLPHEDKAAKAK
ncbi:MULTISPECIES: uracil-xanthine permease family protein [unclassified Agarivorans]|uniref:uracil-xanthine permease family protein n=1 Tax=unclassified Agarivorans TaxID=2636026 RepID=UPI0010F1FFEF|nr:MULTISPECIES: uracil-xanthine permease family protein [unclassified Agarivorans]MDO6684497.1 uracil-xanthine permease family protein [Agarivorans sp. 3_MG-2023]MDO6714662.1 uracil-xanthine permease family protein [Agarivorans sp. 2_MG-2023]MDO6762940.1 uracil-xanthine permease family protein [Agarivorans sp. 1_MG-2023]GDY24619.1 uracil permease [Agarivorans sp. Toyoura001]